MQPKRTSQPTSSGAKNTSNLSRETFSEMALRMNWGGASVPLKQGKDQYLAGTVPDKRPSDQDLNLLADLMRGRQRLP